MAGRTSTGPGRVVIAVYGIFALAATARAGFQVATKFGEAPLAYTLSAFSGLIYIVATIALARNIRRLAWYSIGIELVGVVVVGTISILLRDHFPNETVWSFYGMGYGFVPFVLPIVGLLWLRRTERASARQPDITTQS